MTTRRSLLGAVPLLGLLARPSAHAQANQRLPRVTRLSAEVPLADMTGPDPTDRGARAFVHGLRDLGWVDGRNVAIHQRSAEGRRERLPALLRELVELPADVIVTAGGPMAAAARQATSTIPIVAVGPDLVALGLADSLARPGGNVTGIAFQIGADLSGKRLQLLKRAAPSIKRVAYIRPRPASGQAPWAASTTEAARALGITLALAAVDSADDLDAAFAQLARHRPDAIWCSDSPVNINQRARIAAFALRERLPSLCGVRQFAEAGTLISYATSLADAERRAAAYVDKILKGAKPGELPIEQPTRFELVINAKTAAALGLKLPQELLLQADEVIR